jgi:hypothetical protein
MRCSACHADNPVAATACASCGAALAPGANATGRAKRRRRDAARDFVDSPRSLEYERQVRGIFNLCLVSLVPFLGLVLGPLGALKGWRLLKQARLDPAFTYERGARVAIFLGSLTGVTNWLGLGIMALGVAIS